ncbi:peptidase M3A and M3B thimet/oligopeptidase F [Desulfovibrio sp. X2]|uniref:M3 family metallopeptidase n=1 Tax=Desulfovibrio sp. X2 TaxID=941449 RepID=UPI00035894D7|nr:M3 family metallopeptidase [Desulfovibrio sp. X2]EPR41630.1 peptidase M3A and M3B thimet/oligopeptidase F [Desulfovibrio sp. X2]
MVMPDIVDPPHASDVPGRKALPDAPPRWSLATFFASPADPAVEAGLAQVREDALADPLLAVEDLAGTDAESFGSHLARLDALQAREARLSAYAYLQYAVDTDSETAAVLRRRVEEGLLPARRARSRLAALWARLDPAEARRLMASAEAAPWRHFLARTRRKRRFLLPPREEELWAESQGFIQERWTSLYDTLISGLRVGPEKLSLSMAMQRLRHQRRGERQAATLAISQALEPHLPLFAHTLNSLLGARELEDSLRGRPHWLSQRLQENEIGHDAVAALLRAVDDRRDVLRRFHDLKRRLLGLDRLTRFMDYDRFAPVLPAASPAYTFGEAARLVVDAFSRLGREVGAAAREFFAKQWIDAEPRPGKLPGAFAHPGSPEAHPRVLLHYGGNGVGGPRDVLLLAHELGHGVHMHLSRHQTLAQQEAAPVLAEAVAVFAELVVFRELLARARSPQERLALLCQKLEDSALTTFRQVTLHQVEASFHTARREEGELSPARLAQLWRAPQEATAGGSLCFGPHYDGWWVLIMHFVHLPGYVHGYALAEQIALALLDRFERKPRGFSGRFRELLAAGGSASPRSLLAPFDIDPEDPALFDAGLSRIDACLREAESTAETSGLPRL